MTDAECAEILAEFRKLTLGPELSAALDHAIGVLSGPRKLFGNGAPLFSPADGRVFAGFEAAGMPGLLPPAGFYAA